MTTAKPSHNGLTYDAVAAAAETLTAEGMNPTLRGIRERLGTGSLGTIQQHFQSWKGLNAPSAATKAAGLPEALQRSLTAEIERQRAEASAERLGQLKDAEVTIETLSEENTRLALELDQLKAMLAESRTEADQAKAQLQQLTNQLAEARTELNGKHQEIGRLNERASFLSEIVEQLKQHERTFHEVNNLNAILRTRLEIIEETHKTSVTPKAAKKEVKNAQI